MTPRLLLFLSLIGVTVSIIVGGGGGGGYNDHSGHYSHSNSRDSSDSHEHRPRPHRPRPHRPQPGRPPRERTNCPANWLLFTRPEGNWCAQAFVATLARDPAEAQCQALGATLTGLQSSLERQRLAEAARLLAVQYNIAEGAMWVGGRAKPECTSPRACPDSRNSFYWTDGHTQNGTDGFTWEVGNPALEYYYLNHSMGVSGCATLVFARNGGAVHFWRGFVHGLLDDVWCTAQVRMYACGKLAT
ncbi:hypothetical protein GCK72_003533 [Caenorhabditis remanei]|uniref:C-type lectin domain-containing protein n=1 Tax=Caenorhabditis remanei TaxID=31234 RepID=A0A6A5HXF1_CAERE|nr:hypothetical protein GCK72_003533 [Caenorhabditis remanei]KAF1771706.1 hypothetical protein GCK72_003533 [Caenorhabditis remanei]